MAQTFRTKTEDPEKEEALAFISSKIKGEPTDGKADAIAFTRAMAKKAKESSTVAAAPTATPAVGARPAQSQNVGRVRPGFSTSDILSPAQEAAKRSQEAMTSMGLKVSQLQAVMRGDDPIKARKAQATLKALQPTYNRMYAVNQSANDYLNGVKKSVTEDEVKAASDAWNEARTAARKASLALGMAQTARGQYSLNDNSEEIARAQQESIAAQEAERQASARYNEIATGYQRQQEDAKYNALRARDDFLINSYADENVTKRTEFRLNSPLAVYNAVYSRKQLRENEHPAEIDSTFKYSYVTDDEASIFYYLWNTQGEQAAVDYLKSIDYKLNERRASRKTEALESWASDSKASAALSSALSVLANQGSFAGVIDLTVQNVRREFGDYRPIDYNTPAQLPGKIANTIRSTVAKGLEDKYPDATLFGLTNLASFAYQTGMSMADSGLQLLLNRFGVPEPITLSLMSGGAAQQAVYDARERGASDGQALLYGYAAGAAEYIFEKMSLDSVVESIEKQAGATIGEKLTKSMASNTGLQRFAKGVLSGLINLGKQGLVEGSEEAFTTIANAISDQIINGDKSEIALNAQKLIGTLDKDGKVIDEKRALEIAMGDWFKGLILDAMGGFISGFGMGGTGNVLRNAASNAAFDVQVGRQITDYQNARAAEAQARAARTAQEAQTPSAEPPASKSDTLNRALTRLNNGEELSGRVARDILADPLAMQALRESGALTGNVQNDSAGRTKVLDAVREYALTQAQNADTRDTAPVITAGTDAQAETQNTAPVITAGAEKGANNERTETTFRERAAEAAGGQISDGGQWRAGVGRLLQDLRNAGTARSLRVRARERASLQNQAEARNLGYVSAQDLQVENGTDDKNARILTDDLLTADQKKIVAEYAKNGVTVRFMLGQLVTNEGGKPVQIRAYVSGDGKNIVVQADHTYLTWNQLLDHEELHRRIKENADYRAEVENALLADQKLAPYLSQIIDKYTQAYREVNTRISDNDIIEELLADYRAGFDMLDPLGIANAQNAKNARAAAKDIRAVEKKGAKSETAETVSVGERFSMEAPVEETADLIAIHNLTERNLIDMGELGGAPAPSIAIVKAEAGHTKYGPISLVYTKDTIDPQADRRNRVYGSDAWTPTSPTVGYKLDEKASKALRSRIENILGEDADVIKTYIDDDNLKDNLNRHNGDFATAYGNEDALKYAFLKETGRLDRAPTKEKAYSQYMSNESLRELAAKYNVQELFSAGYDETMKIEPELREWLKQDYIRKTLAKGKADRATVERVADALYSKEQPYSKLNSILYAVLQMENDSSRAEVDTEALRTAIRQEFNADGTDAEYRAWLNDLASGLVAKKGIRNQKDIYTSAGNRRGWDSLYDPYTLENIVRAMASEPQRGASTWGITAGSLQSVTTPEYRNIEEIRADRGRLGAVDQEEFKQLKKNLDARIMDAVERVYSSTKHWSDNRFEEYDLLAAAIINAARGAKTESSIIRSMSKDGYTIGKDIAQELRQLYRDAAQLPTEYFEAKPMRAVGFDEIVAAVVPTNISADARKVLNDNNVNTLEYETGNEADRLEKLNSVEGVRFSREITPQQDADYLAAVERGDIEAAQQMVDEAAEAAGYTVKAYHGTDAGNIVRFDLSRAGSNTGGSFYGRGLYFTSSKTDAENYGENIIPVFLKMQNPLNVDGDNWVYDLNLKDKSDYVHVIETYVEEVRKGFHTLHYQTDKSNGEWHFFNNVTPGQLGDDKGKSYIERSINENRLLPRDVKNLAEIAQAHGYDSIKGAGTNFFDVGTEYVVFDSSQVKSADPVTYDDNGNVIPLSERFNPENEDIRYSIEIDPDVARANSPGAVKARQLADLMRENENLKQSLKKWKAQVKTSDRTQPRESDVRRMAKDLLNEYTSEADSGETAKALQELAHAIMSNDARWTDVRDMAVRLAGDILKESSELVNVGESELYREIRSTIRGYKIAFTQKGDIPDYNEWRKQNFGRLTISKDGIPVDVLWQELQETYGKGFFPDDITNPTDQILYLADLWDRLQDTYVNPFSRNMAEATQMLASEIIDRVISDEIRQAPTTYADRAVRSRNRANLRTEIVKEKLAAEKQRRKDDLARLKEHYTTKEAKSRESRKARELREKITKHARKMTEALLHPTDKRHIPDKLGKGVAAVLSAIDLGSGYSYTYDTNGDFKRVPRGLELGAEETKRTQAFMAVREALLKEAKGWTLVSELLGTVEEPGALTQLVTELANIPIANMNSEQLQVVYTALRGVEKAVSTVNKMLSTARWAEVSEAANAIKAENAGKTAPLELSGPLGKAKDLTRLDMLTPEAYFHRFGKSGDAIFKLLRSAQDAFTVNMKNAVDDTQRILGNTDVSALEKEKHTVTLEGQKVTMTTAQIMELYCLMQRDQGLQHITTGGIMVEPVRQGLKKTTQAEPLRPSMDELLNAIRVLTPEQLRLAGELQKYLSEDMAELGNEATMKVYGYKKFGQEQKYWKIRSNTNEVPSTVEKYTQTTSVANRGFTKAINPQATTSIKIGSIFDTYSQSVNDMATYAAWLAVGEDVNRIRNYIFRDENGERAGTVNGILDRVIGSGGADYLQRLMADIANGAGMDDAGLTSGFVGAYKAAAIGANIRVIIQQPTAILRAAEMIDPKYLAIGLKNPMKSFERAKKYSPIAQWKDWGYFDINTGRKMKDVLFENPSKLEKVRQASMAMAGKADSFAWGQLWAAVEAETKDKTDLKPGTEDFYKACAERFNAIIDHTQVVDGILQRSQIMRSKNAITRMAVSFMSEPTKQYNQFMSAVYDYRHNNDKKQAKQMMARTVFSMLAAGVANVLAQSLIDALRDDDRERKYWEKLIEKFFGYNPDDKTFGEKLKTFAFSNMGELINPASYLPYAKDIMSIIQGYSVDRMDMDAISDTITAMTRLYKAMNGEGKQTTGYSLVKLAEQASKLLGLPAYNLDRDITSLFATIINDADMPVLQYYLNRYRYKPLASGNLSANLKGILWDARQRGDESYDIIVDHMLRDGYEQETIDKAMRAMFADEIGFTAARKQADAEGNNNGSYDFKETLTAIDGLEISSSDREKLLKENLSEAQYAKYLALTQYGEPSWRTDYATWSAVMLALPDSSPTQNEITEVLDKQNGLTTDEKAAIWQILSGTDKTKNNPYNQEVGAEAIEALAKAKGKAASGGGSSGSGRVYAPAKRMRGLELPQPVQARRDTGSGLVITAMPERTRRSESGLVITAK